MYQRIVLAFDGTLQSRTALREGALLALRHNAAVWLLSVADNALAAMAEGVQPGGAQQVLRENEAIMAEGLARLQALGLEAYGHVARGDPGPTIGAFARDVGADLVVLGHRQPKFVERWLGLGSGASIMNRVDCSLLIARRMISDEAFAAVVARELPRGTADVDRDMTGVVIGKKVRLSGMKAKPRRS